MDTNSRNNNIILFIILVVSILTVGSYVPVKNIIFNKQDQIKHYVESSYFSNEINRFSKYLVNEVNKKTTEKDLDYYTYEDVESIKYRITDSEGSFVYSNLDSDYISREDIEASSFFLIIKTDDEGNLTIDYTDNIDINKIDITHSLRPSAICDISKSDYDIMTDEEKQKFKGELGSEVIELHIRDKYGNVEIEKIILDEEKYNNLEITYLVDDTIFQYGDIFAKAIKDIVAERDAFIILGIGLISTLIIIIMAFAFRYSFQSKGVIFRLFNRMFLEIKILCYMMFGFIGYWVLRLLEVEPSIIINSSINTNPYFYIIGIPFIFVYFGLIYLLIVYIKYIYNEGIKAGVIQNSILSRIVLKIISYYHRYFRNLMKVNFSRDAHVKLIIISGIATIFLLVITISVPGPISTILLIGYGVLLFRYLWKLIDRIKLLNERSNNLTKGDFDINLQEDMGILNPIAKNLNNIKQEFSFAVSKATKSQKMKTELISNVSHDLKTPLTSIINYVDLLKKRDVDTQTEIEYINILDEKARRLKVLIEDLFEASKASSGNIDLHKEKLDVNALFKQTIGELQEKLNSSSLIIKLNIPQDKIMCELDGTRTYRIFENIINNILKYSMKGSRVYIDILEDERNVRFVFKNISAYEMTFNIEDITERFTRGDVSRNTEGSGLGLAIAKSLVELQNGKLVIKTDGDLFKLSIIFPKLITDVGKPI